jgi:cell division protein FtsN
VRIESHRRGGLPSLVRNHKVEKFYEVLVGPYPDEESVRSMQGELEKAGYESFVRH